MLGFKKLYYFPFYLANFVLQLYPKDTKQTSKIFKQCKIDGPSEH